MNNEHTYAKITKDHTNLYYKVIITKTGTTTFGNKENEWEIPFVFRSAEIAKDFISILPDKIKNVDITEYKCGICHLCKSIYKTYKLTIGEFNVYIRWQGTRRISSGFISDRVTLTPIENVVQSFVTEIKPTDSRGYDVKWNHNYEYEKLTDLINRLKKEKTDLESQKEEYVFELVQQ